MDYDTKQILRGVATGVVIGGTVALAGVGVGHLITKNNKCNTDQPSVQYNINGDNNTIINSDVRVNTKIRARDITVAPNYNSNQTGNASGTGSAGGSGSNKNTTPRTKPESVDDVVETEKTQTDQTNTERQEDTQNARFKGYDGRGMPYWQVDGCDTRFTINPRMYGSIVFRNNGFWYGSVRLSTMPSDMERRLNNQFRSRPSTTRGNYFHSGWNYGNNDRHW
jgi:hypothetical protein